MSWLRKAFAAVAWRVLGTLIALVLFLLVGVVFLIGVVGIVLEWIGGKILAGAGIAMTLLVVATHVIGLKLPYRRKARAAAAIADES